jgi:hypothetical protein
VLWSEAAMSSNVRGTRAWYYLRYDGEDEAARCFVRARMILSSTTLAFAPLTENENIVLERLFRER